MGEQEKNAVFWVQDDQENFLQIIFPAVGAKNFSPLQLDTQCNKSLKLSPLTVMGLKTSLPTHSTPPY
jgi:hypothetical protein